MDPDTQQYIDVAKKTLDVAEKSGLLKKIVSWFSPQQQQALSFNSVDYREQALLALQENAVETLAGLSLTVTEARRILEPDFSLDDLDKLNSTWQNHWTEGASNVGLDDEERRTWWANLLAEEIKQPETYSLRTLAVMDTLSSKEAKLFRRLCEYVWNPENPVLILPSETSELWKPDFSEETLLESASLAKFSSTGNFTWGTTDKGTNDNVGMPSMLIMTFGQHLHIIESPQKAPVRLRCGKLFLTDVGQEIYRLTTPTHPQIYHDEIVQEWQQSYTVRKFKISENDS